MTDEPAEVHRVGEWVPLSSSRVAVSLARWNVEREIPFDAGPNGRRGLHALRLVIENGGDEQLSAPFDFVEIETASGGRAESYPLFDADTIGPRETVEGWLVFFLPEGEVPFRLRFVDNAGAVHYWDVSPGSVGR